MQTWSFMAEKLQAGVSLVLISVVEVRGSSPGKPGFKMAVAADGSFSGSIGGGVMEYKMVDQARAMLMERGGQPMIVRQVHDPDAGEERSGLICAGEQTHVFMPLGPDSLPVLTGILQALDRGQRGVFVLDPDGPGFSEAPGQEAVISWDLHAPDQWCYQETIGLTPSVYIFGGGHISLPLSQVFRMLGFRVRVYDDRPQLETMTINEFAHEKHLIDYSRALEVIVDEENAYVIIMTVSHASDQMILQQMLSGKMRYLGMIGSSNKVKKIFGNLRLNGFTDEQLSKVDAPIGLPINSISIEEISISIAARVIQVKNNG